MSRLKDAKTPIDSCKDADDESNVKRTLFKVDQKQNKMSTNGTPSTISENSY
jgi:hypothetical protein